MTEPSKPAPRTPTSKSGDGQTHPRKQTSVPKQQFAVLALNMSWQLAIVVLVPLFIGAKLDKHFGTSYLWTFVGLGVAFVLTGLVMWRTVQVANRLPVPKLTEAERRAVRKSYEQEDEDK